MSILLQHRPAGLSSDSDSDDWEFGSDRKPTYAKLNPSKDAISHDPLPSVESGMNVNYENATTRIRSKENLDKLKILGFGSLQNGEPEENKNASISSNDPSLEVKNYDNNIDTLLLDVSNCKFKGSHSSLSSPKISPKTLRKFHLPLEEFRMASIQGNLPIVKALLNQGISVDQTLKSGWTALMFASSCAKPDLVLYLLQHEADPNMHKEMFTSLMAACASSQDSESDLLACVNHLLNYGAKPDACERHRMTPLMFACKEGRVSIVEALFAAKVDVNKQDNKGWTALCWASTKGHGRVVRKLLEYAADPSKMNIHGQRPSDVALAAGYVEIADILEQAEVKGNKIEGDDMKILEKSRSTPNLPRLLKSLTVPTMSYCGEMEMVLNGLELTDLIPLFQDHKITLECFLRLHEKDFVKMGIEELGTRKKLLQAIADIHKQEWKTSSLPNLSRLAYITLPDAVSLIANINKQLRFIHASVGYLRDQIQATPRILELGQEKHNVATLSNSFSASLKNISSLGEEVKFFKAHLDKVCDNFDYSSADLVVVRQDDGRRWQRSLLTSLLAATSLAAVVYFCRPKIFASIFSLTPYPQSSVFLDVEP